MSLLDLFLGLLPVVFLLVAMVRAWPIMKPISARLVLLMFGATLLNLARSILVGRPIAALACLAFSSLAAGWCYRMAVKGELMAEDWERRQSERELDES